MTEKLAWLLLLIAIGSAEAQDLSGAPLPEPYIDQEAHDRVIQAEQFAPDGTYAHWIASGWTLVVEGAELIKTQGELAECLVAATPPCSDFRDGPGGALWKPVSDNTGRPVFLLPEEYKRFRLGRVVAADGAVVALVTFRTCCPNGGRAHFDVNVPAVDLDPWAPIQVLLELPGETHCRIVEVPSERVD